MALILLGKTRCSVCNRVLHEGEQLVAFPAIVSNENDPLYEIRDFAFHATCFDQHPLAVEAQRRLEEWKAKTSTGRKCCLCGQPITSPDDHYSLAHFTADSADPLFAYNYREFHRSCLRTWQNLPWLIAQLDRLRTAGAWKGPVLDGIVQALKNLATA